MSLALMLTTLASTEDCVPHFLWTHSVPPRYTGIRESAIAGGASCYLFLLPLVSPQGATLVGQAEALGALAWWGGMSRRTCVWSTSY